MQALLFVNHWQGRGGMLKKASQLFVKIPYIGSMQEIDERGRT